MLRNNCLKLLLSRRTFQFYFSMRIEWKRISLFPILNRWFFSLYSSQAIQSFVIASRVLRYFHFSSSLQRVDGNHIVFNFKDGEGGGASEWQKPSTEWRMRWISHSAGLPAAQRVFENVRIAYQTKCSYKFWHHIKQVRSKQVLCH